MIRISRTLAVAAALAMVAALGACGSSGGEAKGIKLVEAGKLTVCTHLPYPPFQDRDKKNRNKIVGFDVDMLDLLAKDLGVQQKVVNVGEWTQVTSGAVFDAGKCDVAMGAMTITPERAKALTISEPYFDATQALIVRKDSPYKSIEDLAGKRIGVQTDTTGQIYANKQAKRIKGLTPKRYDDIALELNALKAGNVDAAINDNGPLYNFAKQNPDTVVVQEFHTGEQYGFPAKGGKDPNARKLIDRLNADITKSRKDGTYDSIYQKWFGVRPGEKSTQ